MRKISDQEFLNQLTLLFGKAIQIISRTDFIESSTFPVEIIYLETDNGTLELFCKFLNGMGANNHGHRGGVQYEANVYSGVLADLPLSTIKYYGKCSFNTEEVMVLE